MIRIKLFKPGYTKSELSDFLATHKIIRIKAFSHARRAGLGDYVGITYREEKSNGEPVDKSPTSCD